MKYCVIFAFIDKNGRIECIEDDIEVYHIVYVEADNEKKAEKEFWKQEKFTADKPEIISIQNMEEQK